jgi:hydrogenase nickel incorporation protein HypA/HybF
LHELSLVQALVEQAQLAARESAPGRRLTAVYVDVGELSGAVPEILKELYPLVAEGTELEGSRLRVRKVRARFKCCACGEESGRGQGLGCPGCGSMELDMLRGREIRLTAVDVEEEEGTEP